MDGLKHVPPGQHIQNAECARRLWHPPGAASMRACT